MTRVVIAADIGGTKCAAGIVGRCGEISDVQSAPTPGQDGPATILRTVSELVNGLAAQCAERGLEVAGLGVGSAGVVDPETGRVLSSTDVLRDWAGVGLRDALAELTGVAVVAVDNDVHTHALGEAWLGAASKATSAFFVAVGTGIGASIVVDGRVWHGERNVAGHFGHMPVPQAGGMRCVCGGSGHVEAVAAGPAMVSAYNRRIGGAVTALAEVAALAETGTEAAVVALDAGARALGSAVGGAANLLDPSVVVIGGGVVGAGALWWNAMERSLRAELLPPLRELPVVPAALGSDAALVGAARLVWKEIG